MTHLSDDHLRHLQDSLGVPDLTGTRYELIRRVGIGGMASIYLATDKQLSRPVAIKVATLGSEAQSQSQRMIREANIVAQLEHPSIVPIHDVGTLADGRVFYSMKYVEGSTLEKFVASESSRSARLRVFLRICEAISFAHSKRILHRDLKPANIMVGAFGEVLVMDWGIARHLSEPAESGQVTSSRDAAVDAHITAPGTVMGTPAYMPPEQAEGRTDDVDQRSDIYSLGAVLRFLLLDSLLDVITPPREIDSTIGRPLDAICRKAMAHLPQNRYASVDELARDVAAWLDGLPVSAYRESLLERFGRWVSRNRVILMILVGYTVVRFFIYSLFGR